jgi:hypothetical protein
MKKLFVVPSLLLAMVLGISACSPASPKMELPQGAQKLSDVVPQMGEHWANPAQLPLGPIYLVYRGEVIGLEYMWTEDMMQHLSIPTPEGTEELDALGPLPVGVKVDHVDVAFMEHGHEGFDVPHWDIHLYFVTQEEKAAIMPGG